MQVITGDETGLVKVVDVAARTFTKYGEQSREQGVRGMVWLRGDTGHGSVAAVRASGSVDIYSVLRQEGAAVLVHRECLQTGLKPLSVRRVGSQLLVYDAEGSVCLLDAASGAAEARVSFTVRGPLSTCATDTQGRILFGGRENDVTLYAAETQQLVWEAKNVGQDKLHLRVPVWLACLAFPTHCDASSSPSGSGSSGSSGASSGDVFYAATAHKHVRLYDVRAGQRPVLSIDLDGDLRAAAIQPLSGDRLYVGDTAGGIGLWDLRRGKRTHVLKGAAGSIRHMQLGAGGSGGGETLACVGLDRFLRMYDANQKLSSAVYLKNRLNCCLVLPGEEKGEDEKEREREARKKRLGRRVANEDDEDVLKELDDDDDDEDDNDDDGDDNDDEEDEEDDDEDGEEEKEEDQEEGGEGSAVDSDGDSEEEGDSEVEEEQPKPPAKRSKRT